MRTFFENSNHLEVDTPATSDSVIPEPTIDLMNTAIHGFDEHKSESVYLLPSPEIYMKRLLAAGSGSIFQFSRCFRDREAPSKLHSHEFLMLEWYTIDADYTDSLETTEELLKTLTKNCEISTAVKPALTLPFLKMTVNEAFKEFAGIDLAACNEIGALLEAVERIGLAPDSALEWTELFHLVLVGAVEPALPRDRPVVLLDYPAKVSCLAKTKSGTPWRERWELYLNGVETANCYSEMIAPAEVKAYFVEEGAGQGGGQGAGQGADPSFPDIYTRAHPRCSGVAMGVDRLIMVLAGARSIAEVIPFPRGGG